MATPNSLDVDYRRNVMCGETQNQERNMLWAEHLVYHEHKVFWHGKSGAGGARGARGVAGGG